ncbi:retinol dehydrogenase 13-like [Homalodisca vitripennis]|nr:retinol dehydrogenase 13-like [Homalodisca vitripennis]
MGLSSGKCVATTRLDNKTVIITGCNTGIGKVTVRELYKLGARVVMACRDVKKAEEAAEDIKSTVATQETKDLGEVVVQKLDLSSLTSVRECAKKLLETESHIDILINNAGVMMCPYTPTEDGFEMQFGTNHLGHFLFTCLLLPRIISSAPSRIITLSSVAHARGKIDFDDLNWQKRPYSPMAAYGQSKLANVLFSKELARRLGDKRVTTYAVHPGVIRTELGRHMDSVYFKGSRQLAATLGYFFYKTLDQGAQTTLHCALDPDVGSQTGLYYSDCATKEPSATAQDEEVARKLWEESARLTGVDWDPFTQTQ